MAAKDVDFEENLSCSICLSLFNKPKALRCLHTFCADCISRHMEVTQENNKFRCPVCKAKMRVPDDGVDGLKDHFDFNMMVEKLQDVKLTSPSSRQENDVCTKHPTMQLTAFCEDCTLALCSQCMFPAHSGHKFRSLQEAGKSYDDITQHVAECTPPLLNNAEPLDIFTTLLDERSNCLDIAYVDNKYVVADNNGPTALVLGDDGHFLGNLRQGRPKLKFPCNVTCVGDSIVVAHNNIHGLACYRPSLHEPEIVTSLYRGWGRVTYDRCLNRVIIADDNGMILIYKRDSKNWTQIDGYSFLDAFEPFYITTSPDGKLIVSQDNDKLDCAPCLLTLDSSCTRLLHRFEDNRTNLDFYGVCCDQWGHVIVVCQNHDTREGCLKVISAATGKCLRVIVKDGDLFDPTGVTISGPGKVSVIERNGIVKVYRYLDV